MWTELLGQHPHAALWLQQVLSLSPSLPAIAAVSTSALVSVQQTRHSSVQVSESGPLSLCVGLGDCAALSLRVAVLIAMSHLIGAPHH